MKTKSPWLKISQSLLTILTIAIACTFSIRPAQAGYIVTLQQNGTDVVASGSGPIDLTGLVPGAAAVTVPG